MNGLAATKVHLPRSAKVGALYFSYYLTLIASCWLVGSYFVNFGLVQEISGYWHVVGIFVALIVLMLTPLVIPSDGRPSEFILHMIVILIVAPSLAYFTLTDAGFYFIFVTLISCLFVAVVARVNLPVRPFGLLSPRRASLALLLLCNFYFAALLLYGQASFLNIDMLKVYDLRNAAAANLPYAFNYFLPWVSKTVATAGLALAIYQRKFLLFVAFSLTTFGIFAFGAHKEPVLFPFIVAATYYFACDERRVVPMLLIAVFGGYFLMVDSFELGRVASQNGDRIFWYPGVTLFSDFLLRRGIMTPAMLNHYFIDFFSASGNHLYWWSGSRITMGLLQMPYPEQPPYKIGIEYFNSATMSANAGWIGTGYANAHILGSLIYSAVLGLILALMDAFGRYISKKVIVAMFIAPVLTLIMSGDLFTSLLTHGLLPTMLLAFLFRAPETAQIEKDQNSVGSGIVVEPAKTI